MATHTSRAEVAAMFLGFKQEDLHNESDVEQKFIVRLLTASPPEGLGYSLSDFRSKADLRTLVIDKGSSKKRYYPDYAIILHGLPLMIIEAKAPGEDLDEALREAILYAHQINLLYPASNPCSRVFATDGRKIVASRWDGGQRIDVDLENMSAVDCDFSKFTDFASKASLLVDAESMLKAMRKHANFVTPIQLMGGRVVAESTVGENSFGANVSIAYKYLFNPETREDRSRLVENAYITSQKRLSHVAPIDRLIRSTLPSFSVDARPIEDTSNPSTLLSELEGRSRAGELCLLIGSVGSGKSTFTDYLRTKGISPSTSKGTDWVHANLNLAPLNRDRIYDWIVDTLSEELRKSHDSIDMDDLAFQRKIYGLQLSKVEKGRASLFEPGSLDYNRLISDEIAKLEADRQLTLKLTIDHLYRTTGRTLIVVLDNCDKRSRDDQLLMFEVATWLKNTMHCMVFLPLRDVTYDAYRNSPPLDTVIKDLVFRIDPPRLDQVIQARLDYAIREAKAKPGKFYYTMENGMRGECAHHEVGQYLASLVSSVFQNHRFKQIVSGLAGRDIRKGIEIVLDLCKSGHIPEAEILKARTTHGLHNFPSNLIMQILLKGKRKYYSDSETHLKNVFHSDGGESLPDPFVRLAILNWLQRNSNTLGPNKIKGFHKVGTMYSDLQAAGFAEGTISTALHDLLEAGCCTSESNDAEPSREDLISLSPAGNIHLTMLDDAMYLATVAESVLFRENQPALEIKEILIGNGNHKAGTRTSNILIAEILTKYLASYFKDFHIAPSGVLNEHVAIDLLNLGAIESAISRQAAADRHIAVERQRAEKYPPGTKVSATIALKLGHAIIVQFDDRLQAFVRMSRDQVADLLIGSNIEITLGEWNAAHQRYSASHS